MQWLGGVALVVAVVLGAAAVVGDWARRRRRAEEEFETIPYEDLHPVVSYLHGMCGRPGQEVSDFSYAGCVWLTSGRLRGMPRGARRLRQADRAGLPRPYADRRDAQPVN